MLRPKGSIATHAWAFSPIIIFGLWNFSSFLQKTRRPGSARVRANTSNIPDLVHRLKSSSSFNLLQPCSVATHVGPTLFERQTAVCSIVAVTETAKNAEAKGFNRNSCLGVFSDHHFWLNIVTSIDDSDAFEPHSCSVGV